MKAVYDENNTKSRFWYLNIVQQLHRIDYDDGDSDMLDLDSYSWHIDDGTNGFDTQRLSELQREAYALEDGDAFDYVSKSNQTESTCSPLSSLLPCCAPIPQ